MLYIAQSVLCTTVMLVLGDLQFLLQYDANEGVILIEFCTGIWRTS